MPNEKKEEYSCYKTKGLQKNVNIYVKSKYQPVGSGAPTREQVFAPIFRKLLEEGKIQFEDA